MNKFIKNDSTPLYLQVKSKIKKEIRSGLLKPGDQLPSESQMQKEYNISRVTIRNALSELESEGYITKVHGKGSFVAKSDMLRLPIGVTSLSEDARMQGLKVDTTVIKVAVETVRTEIDKEFFKLNDGDEILVIKRIRRISDIPVIVEESHLSMEYQSLQEEDLTQSLYEILQKKYNVYPTNKGRRSVKISFATEEIADYLQLSTGTPVIESEMCVFDMNGEPVHTLHEYVRGDNDRIFKWYV